MNKTDVKQIVTRIKYEIKKQLEYKGYSDGTFSITNPQYKYGSHYTIERLATEWLDAVHYFDDVPNKEWLDTDTIEEIQNRINKWVNKIETHKNDWLEL